jgi:hypothetical protein
VTLWLKVRLWLLRALAGNGSVMINVTCDGATRQVLLRGRAVVADSVFVLMDCERE